MAVELRTLRVSAEMDAAKYVAGAKAVEGSSASAGKAVGGLGASVQQTDQKISQSGDVMERLARQYADGHGAAVRLQREMTGLSRAIDKQGYDAARVQPILEGMYRRYGQLGSGATFAAKGQVELAAAIDRTTAKMQVQAQVASRMPAGANDNEATFRRRNLNYQLFDVSQGLALGMNPGMIAMQQGPQILQMYAGQGGVNAALKDAGSLASTLVLRLGPIAAVAGLGALAISNMRGELEKTEGRAVTFGETFSAVMKVIWSDVKSLIGDAVEPIAPYFQAAFDKVTALALDAGNAIINSFHAAYVDVQYVWEQFPNMIGSVVITGLNAVVGGVEDMLNSVTASIDSWIEALNSKLTSIMGPGTKFEKIGKIDFGGDLPNPYADPLKRGTGERNRRVGEIMGSNPLGDYYKSVRDRVGAALQPVGTEELAKLNKAAQEAAQAALDEANKLALKAIEDTRATYKDAFKGFFSDFRSGIEEGKGLWKSFADAALNALDKIISKLLDKTLDQLFDGIFGPSPSAFKQTGGGFLGMIMGTGGTASPAANDNYAPGAVARMPLPPVGGAYGTDLANNIRQLSANIGANPRDMAALMSFESGMNPNRWGGAGGRHYGLIQAGGPERAQYGITPGGSLSDQFGGIERYFKDRGFKPGMGGLDLYSTVNAGRPGLYGASDAANGGTWGTVRDKWEKQMGPHFEKADKLLGSFNDNTAKATQSLTGLDGGLGKVVQALGGGTGAGAGAGGLFGLGLSNMGAGFNPTRTGFMDMLGGGAGAGAGVSGGGGILKWLMGLFGIPGFASGTNFAPGGLARINEGGLGEIVDLPRGTRVIPHDVSMQMARSGTGYGGRDGGRGVNVSTTIINNTPAKIETREEDDGEGGRKIVHTISDQVTSAMNKPGTSLNREMRSRGAPPARKRR